MISIFNIIERAEEKDNEGGTPLPSPPRGRCPDRLEMGLCLGKR